MKSEDEELNSLGCSLTQDAISEGLFVGIRDVTS